LVPKNIVVKYNKILVYDISNEIIVSTEPNNKNLVLSIMGVQRLKMFRNRILRRMFGPEEEKMRKKNLIGGTQ
jgi:hypothetical protein